MISIKVILISLLLVCSELVFAQSVLPPYVINPPLSSIPWEVSEGTYPWWYANELVHEDPNTIGVHGDAQVEFKSLSRVRISAPFRATDLISNGRFHAYIGADPFETQLLTSTQNGSIGKHEKVEFGIALPENVQDAINIFLDYNNGNYGPYHLNGWQALGGVNPFLDWEIRVYASIVTKDENEQTVLQQREVDAFFFRDFLPTNVNGLDVDWVQTQDQSFPFHLRFAPDIEGKVFVSFFVEVPGQPILRSSTYQFNVIDMGAPGFVKVGASGKYLTRDGETFFPIGRNHSGPRCNNCENSLTGYPSGTLQSGRYTTKTFYPEAYHSYLNEIQAQHDQGSRYFRMMSHPHVLEIEFERVGNYTGRLHIAHEIDKIFEKVENLGMMIHWNLQYQTALSKVGPYSVDKWDWSIAQGTCATVYTPEQDPGIGYASELGLGPLEFLEDEQGLKYYEQRLRYIFSRWGYSTSLAVVEFMNELENFGAEERYIQTSQGCEGEGQVYNPYLGSGTDAQGNTSYNLPIKAVEIGNWIKRMAHYVKSPDKLGQHQHLLALNYANSNWFVNSIAQGAADLRTNKGDNAISSPDFDILSFHYYERNPDRMVDEVDNIRTIQQNMMNKLGYLKPIMFSEGGTQAEYIECGLVEGRDVEWIRTLIGSAFTGAANAAMPWSYQRDAGDPSTWGSQLSVYQDYLRTFMEGIDLEGENWVAKGWKRNDGKVGMTYLMRPDGRQITGLIDNWTYNFFTAAQANQLVGTPCFNFNASNLWVELPNLNQFAFADNVASFNDSGFNDFHDYLMVTDLAETEDYIIGYYDAFHVMNAPPVPTTVVGPVDGIGFTGYAGLILDHPTLETPEVQDPTRTPLMLFRAEHISSPFNRTDSGTMDEYTLSGRTGIAPESINTSIESDGYSSETGTFHIFPNPTHSGIVHVVAEGQHPMPINGKFELFDTFGKLVMNGRLENNTIIDLSRHSAGIYNLRLNSNGTQFEYHKLILTP